MDACRFPEWKVNYTNLKCENFSPHIEGGGQMLLKGVLSVVKKNLVGSFLFFMGFLLRHKKPFILKFIATMKPV
jgi:hypothetical protein